eukprot:237587-Rhodomonas_salina.3
MPQLVPPDGDHRTYPAVPYAETVTLARALRQRRMLREHLLSAVARGRAARAGVIMMLMLRICR